MGAAPQITPVLLCGGSGTRLWPLSRQSYPKQFAALIGDSTLFQATATRLAGDGYARPMILTNTDFRFIAVQQLAEIGIDPGAVLIEPHGRNTAPAVLAAALWQAREDPDGLLLISPSDHLIPDADAFRAAVAASVPAAQDGQLVTFGITPGYPETGYGYLELEGSVAPGAPCALRTFVEKPDRARAEEMLAHGGFLWNAGIFLFSVRAIIAAFEAHAPDMIARVQATIDSGTTDLGFFRLADAPWRGLDSISIDYAVMEKATNLSVMPFDAGWSDLGGWDAVWREGQADAQGTVTSGPATAIGCSNSLLRSEDEGLELVGVGLDNIVAVAMPDAVLVADRAHLQDVKQVVGALKGKSAAQATEFPRVHRPWGWSEALVHGDGYQVNYIHLNPGAAISLQSHQKRAEHWVVVEGTAHVTIDEATQVVRKNQSVYIPIGARHRLENQGDAPMVLIEVQTGAYSADDIQHFGRVQPGRPG